MMAACSSTRRAAAGFTLLEMLLVLILLGLMASAGLLLSEGVEDQARYDETKRRLELIRRAIVGDPTRTVNGAPEISGFVVDMGRLPSCLAELLEPGEEITPATSPRTFTSPCDDTVTISDWVFDTNTGIGSGWRGPYLQVLPETSGNLRFRDGYGNEGSNATADARNAGWDYTVSGSSLSVTSLGFDAIGTGDDVAAPQLIVGADWEVQLPAAVSVTFVNQSTSNDLPDIDEKLVLRVYLSNLTDYVKGDDDTNPFLTLSTDTVLQGGNRTTETFILDSSPTLPIGIRGYALVCYELPAGDPNEYRIFDGRCAASNPKPDATNIRSFSVVPRQTLTLNLDWIIR